VHRAVTIDKTVNHKKTVVLKDAWVCIEAHGHELRHMGAHGAAWTRTDFMHSLID